MTEPTDGSAPQPMGTACHRQMVERYISTLPERAERGQGLYLTGGRGLGKSMLMAIILSAAADRFIAGRFEPCAAMLRASSRRSDEGQAYLKTLCRVPLLGVDDLGTEEANGWTLSVLFQVIDHRYAHRLPTLVTTNLASDELQARYTTDREAMGRLLDRLLERNRALVFRGKSYRQFLREEW